mmetsp:Transcript_18230/g.35221  ORF Transcript_18230/g.35221 Transcript_18230/m.35221 type:complete len:212 (-) Transcript_18230:37-672(-)
MLVGPVNGTSSTQFSASCTASGVHLSMGRPLRRVVSCLAALWGLTLGRPPNGLPTGRAPFAPCSTSLRFSSINRCSAPKHRADLLNTTTSKYMALAVSSPLGSSSSRITRRSASWQPCMVPLMSRRMTGRRPGRYPTGRGYSGSVKAGRLRSAGATYTGLGGTSGGTNSFTSRSWKEGAKAAYAGSSLFVSRTTGSGFLGGGGGTKGAGRE